MGIMEYVSREVTNGALFDPAAVRRRSEIITHMICWQCCPKCLGVFGVWRTKRDIVLPHEPITREDLVSRRGWYLADTRNASPETLCCCDCGTPANAIMTNIALAGFPPMPFPVVLLPMQWRRALVLPAKGSIDDNTLAQISSPGALFPVVADRSSPGRWTWYGPRQHRVATA